MFDSKSGHRRANKIDCKINGKSFLRVDAGVDADVDVDDDDADVDVDDGKETVLRPTDKLFLWSI